MNARQVLTTATLMPTVPTPKDRFIARVIRGTLETELHVLVSGPLGAVDFLGLKAVPYEWH